MMLKRNCLGATGRVLSAICFVACYSCALSTRAEAGAKAIIERFYAVAGGQAWQRFEECDSTGAITLRQKTGALSYWEDLRGGANRSQVEIDALDLKEANGDEPDQSWHQDASGDIQLGPDNPDKVDDRYLTRRGYWEANFGGATVRVLAPHTEGSAIWDRLQFKVPGGRGFTLWLSRATGLLDRIEAETTKQLGDYRRVNGVMLPFFEKKHAGEDELRIVYTSRILRERIDAAAFAIPFHDDYEMPPSGIVTVPAENGLILHATINGKGPFKAVFDTGSVNLMSAGLARRLGLTVEKEGIPAGTSSPAQMQLHKARVDSLQIGDLIVRDQTFYVADIPDDEDAPSFAVGYELLRRFAVRMDYGRQEITLYDGPRFRYQGSGTAVPLQINGNELLVDGSIEGATGKFELDSGNESGFMVNTQYTVQNDLVHKLGATFLAYNGRGYAGPSPKAYIVRVQSMRIGDLPVLGVIGRFSTDRADKRDFAGNIGQNILTRFTEIFDCMRGVVYFETTARSNQPEIFNRAGLIFDSFGNGLQVMTVLPGSPAATAGLQTGDVITAINGETPSDDMKQPAFEQPVGTAVALTFRRGDTTRSVRFTLQDVL